MRCLGIRGTGTDLRHCAHSRRSNGFPLSPKPAVVWVPKRADLTVELSDVYDCPGAGVDLR